MSGIFLQRLDRLLVRRMRRWSATGARSPLRVRVVPTLQPFCYSFPVTLGFQRVSASRWTSQRVVGVVLSGNAGRFLAEIAAELRREIGAIKRMDSVLVERDIAARRREAVLGTPLGEYADQSPARTGTHGVRRSRMV
jgi:hypothetical protein